MKKYILAATFLLLISDLFTQEGLERDVIENTFLKKGMSFSSTPEAAGLARELDVSVGHFSGALNVTVPLEQLTVGNFTLPLYLSHDGSGHRVGSVESWVGLGWNLHAGGSVSRQVRGAPDNHANYYSQANEIRDNSDVSISIDNYHFMQAVVNEDIETQCDLFSFSAPGISGKFIITPFNVVIQEKDQDIRIHISRDAINRIDGFTIYAANGTKYIFGHPENVFMAHEVGIEQPKTYDYNVAWHLKSIETIGEQTSVFYEYDEYVGADPTSYQVFNREQFASKRFDLESQHCSQISMKRYGGPEQMEHRSKFYLKKIKMGRGADGSSNSPNETYYEVDFLSSPNNSPFKSAHARKLNHVRVERYHESNVNGPACLKYYHLEYEDTQIWKRLMLSSVTEKDCNQGGLSIPEYKFKYNQTKLPSPTSSSQDKWGFCNSAGEGSSMIPTVDGLGEGANREPSESKMKASSLESITHPTGAITTFTLEPHRDSKNQMVGGLRVKSIVTRARDGALLSKKSYNYGITIDGIHHTTAKLRNDVRFDRHGVHTSYPVYYLGGSCNPCMETTCYSTTISASNSNHNAATQGPHIVYGVVEEVVPGKGKTQYHFDRDGSAHDADIFNIGLGDLLLKRVYHENGKMLLEEDYQYELYQVNDDPNDESKNWLSFAVLPQSHQDNKIYLYHDGSSYKFTQSLDEAGEDHHIVRTKLFKANRFNLSSKSSRVRIKSSTNYYYDEQFQVATGSTQSSLEYDYNTDLVVPVCVKLKQGSEVLKQVDMVYTGNHDCSSNGPSDECGMQLSNILHLPKIQTINGGAGGKYKVDYIGNVATRYYDFDSDESNEANAWRLISEIEAFYTNKYPLRIKHRGEDPISYYWNRGSLSKKYWSGYSWDVLEFNFDGSPKLISDIDGQRTRYEKDDLWRLTDVFSREDNVHQQYVYTYGAQTGTNSHKIENFVTLAGTNYAMNSVSLLDDLGRAVQVTRPDYLPENNDLVTTTRYDIAGMVTNVSDPTKGNATTNVFEQSPLGRLESSSVDGWTGNVSQLYGTNGTAIGDYSAQTLFMTQTTDENGNRSKEYKNALGQVVLSRVINDGENLDTYYKYNERGQVTNIRPPGEESFSGPAAYIYTYDGLGRLETKKIPGQSAPISYTYNDRDLVETMTDANGNMTRTVYDVYGNVIELYLTESGSGEQMVQEFKYHAPATSSDPVLSESLKTIETGKLEYQKDRVLGTNDWITTSYFYDEYGRVERTEKTNISGGIDIVETDYDMADLVKQTDHTVNYDGDIYRYRLVYNYDRGQRQTTLRFDKLFNGASFVQLSEQSYFTDNGWLKQKKLGKEGSDWLQEVDYQYNRRGWLTHINELPEACIAPPYLGKPGGGDGQTTYDGDIKLGYDGDGLNNGSGSGFDVEVTLNHYEDGVLTHTDFNQGGFDVGNPNSTATMPDQTQQDFQGPLNPDLMTDVLLNDILQDAPNLTPNMTTQIDDQLGDILTDFETGCVGSNEDLFSMQLYYDDLSKSSPPGGKAQFNGNIARIGWHSADHSSVEYYTYSYDQANRLRQADNYSHSLANGAPGPGNYSTSYSYDLRGNIKSIQRDGWINPQAEIGIPLFGPIDDITLNYHDDNRLDDSDDLSGNSQGHFGGYLSYSFDDNGNVLSDTRKTIDYNFLNLPKEITLNGGTIAVNYDAAGSKHSKVSPEETREYLMGAVFVDGEIEAIHHPEGRVVFMDGVVEYEYSIRDHLGNTRVSFIDLDDDGIIDPKASGDELVQENHYYPFGLNIQNPNYANSADPKNNYQYNGKELVDDLGLGWMDYGARWYDPSICRFPSIDRFVEKFVNKSSFVYAGNNPIKFIDINGDSIYIAHRGEAIKYSNGKVTDAKTGQDYTGKYTNKKGNLKGFFKKAVNGLDKIKNGGSSGKKLINTLDKSSQKVLIQKGNNKAQGTRAYWDPSDLDGGQDVTGTTARPPFIALAHELAHVQDKIEDGTVDFTQWFSVDGKSVPEAEKYATDIENRIRSENGLSLRSNYTNANHPQGRLLDKNNRSLYPAASRWATQKLPTLSATVKRS